MTKVLELENSGGKVRLDRWLNAARIFPNREMAAEACDGGKVDLSGSAAKSHKLVGPGDRFRVTAPGGEQILVIGTAARETTGAEARPGTV